MIENLIIGVLTSLIACLIFKYAYMFIGKKPKKTNRISINEQQREKIEKLIKIGYIALRLDEIPVCGNWGLTVNRYIEINYPNDNDILAPKNQYLKEGSITHSAHALRGLCFLNELSSGIDTDAIRSWIIKHTEGPGFLNSPKPANPDEVKFYAKELRHTVTSLLALSYMKNGPEDIAIKCKDKEWIKKHFDALLKQRKRWLHDSRMTYSYAYLIELLTRMKSQSLFRRKEISRLLIQEINKLFDLVDENNRFWCASSHPDSMFFYTLMIIDHISDTVELHKNKKARAHILSVLKYLGKNILPKYNGIPLGDSDIDRFNKADLYSTATFLRVVWKFQRYNNEFALLFNETKEHLLRMIDNLDQYSDNFITHTWEAVLGLTELFELNKSLPAFLKEYDPKIDEIRKSIRCGNEIPNATIKELDNKTCSNGVLVNLIQRDVIDNWNARKSVLEKNQNATV